MELFDRGDRELVRERSVAGDDDLDQLLRKGQQHLYAGAVEESALGQIDHDPRLLDKRSGQRRTELTRGLTSRSPTALSISTSSTTDVEMRGPDTALFRQTSGFLLRIYLAHSRPKLRSCGARPTARQEQGNSSTSRCAAPGRRRRTLRGWHSTLVR